MAGRLWGWHCSHMIHFLPGTKAPVLSQAVGLCRLSSLGQVLAESAGGSQAPGPPGPPAWPATHQVDAVGVHAVQGPPAQVRVVVLGIGLYSAGVVAQGAADREQWLSVGLPAWPEADRTCRY